MGTKQGKEEVSLDMKQIYSVQTCIYQGTYTVLNTIYTGLVWSIASGQCGSLPRIVLQPGYFNITADNIIWSAVRDHKPEQLQNRLVCFPLPSVSVLLSPSAQADCPPLEARPPKTQRPEA